ncbi:MAG: hypothetical protein OCD02_20170 [Spirochaetaceae bacterium]
MKNIIKNFVILLLLFSCDMDFLPIDEDDYIDTKYDFTPSELFDDDYVFAYTNLPDISINSVDNGILYEFEISSSDTYSDPLYSAELTSDNLAFILPLALPEIGDYYCRARVKFSADEWSSWGSNRMVYISKEVYDSFESTGDTFSSLNTWDLSATYEPIIQTDNTYDGSQAVEFDISTTYGTSSMSSTITFETATVVSYYLKKSSGGDFSVYIDESTTAVQELSDEISDWTKYSFIIASGTHTVKWEYTKSSDRSSDSAWLDYIEFSSVAYYNDFNFDFENNIIPDDLEGDWIIDNINSYTGGYSSLRAAIIDSNEESSISYNTDIDISTTISFKYKVSSESGYDYFKFYIDDSEILSASGTSDWLDFNYVLSEGEHELKWEYSKDSSVDGGSDTVFIDNLSLRY